MSQRLKKGYTCDDDIPQSGRKASPVTINGKRYQSVKHASEVLDIPEPTLYYRLRVNKNN